MIHIDGSYGEGGGQILRTAMSLSILTGKPLEIRNIRAKRSKPGLRPQHHTAIKIIGKICNAEIQGLEIGSSTVKFYPGEISADNKYSFDIGTAGSIVLVFEACILSSIKTKNQINIKLKGGTDVKWAPSWDYFLNVFIPLLDMMNYHISAKLINRGYYPKGGGEAEITINPCTKLKPLVLKNPVFDNKIDGIIHIANLPEHIGKRMKHAVIKKMVHKNINASLNIENSTSLSAGTGLTLWNRSNNYFLGTVGLGERGIPAEKIGENTALELISEIESYSSLDIHGIDQIIPFLALADNSFDSEVTVRFISSHAETNMWCLNKFFEDRIIFSISDFNGIKKVVVSGLNYL